MECFQSANVKRSATVHQTQRARKKTVRDTKHVVEALKDNGVLHEIVVVIYIGTSWIWTIDSSGSYRCERNDCYIILGIWKVVNLEDNARHA